ncbi:DEAD/DEAH box helicase [Nocardia sp. BMG111209]|uniref:DEAD/DEAH box helicase n=1 Tax=Nocardia sp. BMG111209 TaxID=1160137 RepID=UPI0012DF6492|nr:DEAD/DEAH box helicase [Nocardia sp. BMG111209]
MAAEALEVAGEVATLAPEPSRPWLFGTNLRFERVEAGLLYLIAGFDANAALIGREIDLQSGENEPTAESAVSSWTLASIRGLLLLELPSGDAQPPLPAPDSTLHARLRHAILVRLGEAIRSHLHWLMFISDDATGGIRSIRRLIEEMERRDVGIDAGAPYSDLHHLALLLAAGLEGTADRALRTVSPPPDDDGRFVQFQRQRSWGRPLLWPAAAEYAKAAMPGPHAHAVVSVPTGAGKSAVAELAIAQAIRDGWVLYLSPTNALAGQIRRQLNEVVGALPGVTVREFVGGIEYTDLEGEALGVVSESQILVMTPEKCSLALRQDPSVFERMTLCVVDEAHSLGESGQRAVIAELVVSEVLFRAKKARVLMLSALLANPADIADWLRDTTGIDACVVDTPWRPTRTLRAIVGFDQNRYRAVKQEAVLAAQDLPKHLKNVTFDAPLALFAGLQGAWRTSESIDFAFAPTSVRVPLKYHSNKGVDLSGYLNPTVQALVQSLGQKDHRVLAFLPSNKHYCFLAARKMPGFAGDAPVELTDDINALLVLAEAELGGPSALRQALIKRLAVHTSAMLAEERRASELAFEQGAARAMFATGTMAQGLNLPATAVVIGGTKIGWDQTVNSQEEKQRARAQLLNAIGRAGRANVAPRSMAIVVPDKAIALDIGTQAASTVNKADFLREEDASTEISSQLRGLIEHAMNQTLDVDSMTRTEQTAFAFLSYAAEGNTAEGVLRHSWAVHSAGATAVAAQLSRTLNHVGRVFLHKRSAPAWVALAAHRSGIALPDAASLHRLLSQYLIENPPPRTIREWVRTLLVVLYKLDIDELKRIFLPRPFESTNIAPIWSDQAADRGPGWVALKSTLEAWLEGKPLIDIAKYIERKDPQGKFERGLQDPLPRTLRVVTEGFGFGLVIVAGALGAIVAAGRESEPDGIWDLPEDSARVLALLPLAIRYGAGTPSAIAWMRAGARPRVVAHLLDRLIIAPIGLDDKALHTWARAQLRNIATRQIEPAITDEERTLVDAMVVSGEAI